MSDWIKWCSCHRRILTTGQQKENKPCELCQKEHAQGFPDRVKKVQTKEEENV